MSTIVRMPQLGESVVEGTVARWLKSPGEHIAKNEALLEISTDKIDTEVPAPTEGVLLEIRAAAGSTVRAGAALAAIGSEAEYSAAQQAETQVGAPTDPASSGPNGNALSRGESSGEGSKNASAGGQPAADALAASAVAEGAPPVDAAPGGRAFVSPVVARMAAEHQIDLTAIAGSGLGGRVTKKDVEAYLQQPGHRSESFAGREPGDESSTAERDSVAAESTAEVDAGATGQTAVAPLGPDEVLTPLTTMRRAIAQHMVMSKRTSPHVTTIFEADMTAVIRHREAHKRVYAAKGIALTYTPYFIAAIVAGLRVVPQANSRFTEAGIAVNKRMHIGLAVALTHGLVVPVVCDADEKNLQGLARLINELVDRTRRNTLRPEDVQGGTFTLTNHGTGGSLLATPIINQPQTGILGTGAVVKRPVVRSSSPSLLPNADDSIVIRPMCYLSFTFDHRVLDGAQGDEFLTAVKQRLENWQ